MTQESVFGRAYGYRQREGKNNLENFTTEIFAFSLVNDEIFKFKFLQKIGVNDLDISVETQNTYNLGRPDIEIISKNHHIIIECKIESSGSKEQLERYKRILIQTNKPIQKLIYLTKYFVPELTSDIIFIRWFEILELIDNTCDIITNQLKIFLIEKSIAMNKNFMPLDIVNLQNIHNTISKMDEVFSLVEERFISVCGAISDYSARSTRMQKEGDGYYSSCKFKNFTVYIGFFWFAEGGSDEKTVYAGLCIEMSNLNNVSIKEELKTILPDWGESDWEVFTYLTRYINVMSVMSHGSNNDQITEIAIFLKSAITELENTMKVNESIFAK